VKKYEPLIDFLQENPDNLRDVTGPAFLEHLLAKMDEHIVKK